MGLFPCTPAKSPWAPSASWGCPPAPGSSCPSRPPRCSSPSCSYSHSYKSNAPQFRTFEWLYRLQLHDFITIMFYQQGYHCTQSSLISKWFSQKHRSNISEEYIIHAKVENLERGGFPPLIFLNLEGEPALEEGRESVSLPCKSKMTDAKRLWIAFASQIHQTKTSDIWKSSEGRSRICFVALCKPKSQ